MSPSNGGLLCIMFFLVPMGINAEAEDVFSLAEKRIVLLFSEVKDCTCLCSVSQYFREREQRRSQQDCQGASGQDSFNKLFVIFACVVSTRNLFAVSELLCALSLHRVIEVMSAHWVLKAQRYSTFYLFYNFFMWCCVSFKS